MAKLRYQSGERGTQMYADTDCLPSELTTRVTVTGSQVP